MEDVFAILPGVCYERFLWYVPMCDSRAFSWFSAQDLVVSKGLYMTLSAVIIYQQFSISG